MSQSYPKIGTDIQRERERRKYESRDVRICAQLKMNFVYRYYTLGDLIPLVHIHANYRLYTRTLRLIDRKRERETWIERRTYTRTISYNIDEQ